MKKTFKIILSTLLALVLLISVGTVAFAEDEDVNITEDKLSVMSANVAGLPIPSKFDKVGKVVNKSEKNSKLADVVSAAAFIGIIAAFVAREIDGKSKTGDNAGFLSIATLIASVLLFLLLDFVTRKFKWEKFEPFVMPVSMFGAMGVAMLLSQFAPASLVNWTWWN